MNYLILSLKHSTKATPIFWRADNAGFTCSLEGAGVYTSQQVEGDQEYYNNGMDTLAIPTCEAGYDSIGLKITYDVKKTLALADKVENQRKGGK